MRARISERNFFPNFSPKEEYLKLHQFLCDKRAFQSSDYNDFSDYSFFDLLDRIFDKWKLKGSFTTLEEMMRNFQIRKKDVSDAFSEDNLLDYIQFILNAIDFLSTHISYPFHPYGFHSIKETILHHCALLLKKMNAEEIRIDDEIVVLYKNDVAAAAAIHQPELNHSIVEYLKIDNRDDLEQKAEILCGLYKQLEPNKKQLQDNGFDKLYSHTSFLLNEAGIRHALIPGKSNPNFLSMSRQELIKWYDRAFEMILACMAVLPYSRYRREFENLTRNKQG